MVDPPEFEQLVIEEWLSPDIPSMLQKLIETWVSPDPYYPQYFELFRPGQITKVEMGLSDVSHVDLTAIEYGSERALGSGPGGDFIAPQTVLNRVNPTGVLNFNKWWEFTIGLREDEYQALFNTPVSDSLNAVIMDGENAPITYLAVTQKTLAGVERKIVYGAGQIYISGVEPSKLTTEDGKYLVEVKFLCSGSRGFTFPNQFVNEHWTYTIPPTMYSLVTETWISDTVPSFAQLVVEGWGS